MNSSNKFQWPTILDSLRTLKRADVPREVSAGVTLAALMIPLNIGYAQVAGLPPAAGLYAAIIPLVVFALLTSSRHLVTSPDASMATLVGATLVAFAAPGDPLRLQYALALAVVCALLFFVFWIFRLAFLANFLSRAVMAGFITGLGIEVFTNQIRKILAAPHANDATTGLLAAAENLRENMESSVNTEGYFLELLAMFHSIPQANLYSVAVGVSAFLLVRLMKRYAPKIPGALVALVLLTTIVAVLDLPAKGVGVLGNTIPSGARSQLPSLVAAGTILLVMLFFTDLLAYLPNAALAGIVANAVLSLIEVHEFRELWRIRRSEFWIATVCCLSVLAIGPLLAVVIAFLLSTIDLVRRASRPGTWVLKEAPDGSHFVAENEEHAADTPGILIYRFGAPLYFANAALFQEEVENVIAQAAFPIKWFVLDAEAMMDIDTTGEQTLHQVASRLTKRGVTFAVTRANQQTRSLLARYHLLPLIGENRLYPTNRHAIAAFRQETEPANARPAHE